MTKRFRLYLALGFLIILAGCAGQKDLMPERDCPIEQLLLDQSDYPSDTVFDAINSPIAEEPRESASQSAYYKQGWLGEIVIRYSSTDRANKAFIKHKESVFHPNEVYGSWDTPPILSLDNLSTDRHEIACGNVRNFGKRCIMVGQYREYFVLFSADVSDLAVTHELVRDLILKIDKKMSPCLDR